MLLSDVYTALSSSDFFLRVALRKLALIATRWLSRIRLYLCMWTATAIKKQRECKPSWLDNLCQHKVISGIGRHTLRINKKGYLASLDFTTNFKSSQENERRTWRLVRAFQNFPKCVIFYFSFQFGAAAVSLFDIRVRMHCQNWLKCKWTSLILI